MFTLILLAGGLATRMGPITKNIPKSMIDINGYPFIHHQLLLLKSKGISHIIICIGHLGKLIQDYVGDGSNYQLNVEYSFDGNILLGTGGAIRNIGNRLPENFFVLYGDSYLDINYRILENVYNSSDKKCLMTIYKNKNKWDSSNVVFRDGRLIKYSKKQKLDTMYYIDYGLGILNKFAFELFPENLPYDLADVYEQLSDEGQLMGFEVFEKFHEIGSSEGLNDLRKKLAGYAN
jgi:NDP-sugar pyrophosphorylase family protein